jgi:hypothetical protein
MLTRKRVQDTHRDGKSSTRIVAVNFAENSYMEMLLRLRVKDRKTYDTLSPALIQSVNIYSANKREFEQLQQVV